MVVEAVRFVVLRLVVVVVMLHVAESLLRI